MRSVRGFTLVELIIVIIILGILAVTAAPRFINFTDSARTASFEAMAGTLRSTAEMVNLKQRVQAKSPNESVIIDGLTVDMINGYPSPGSMRELVSVSGGRWELEDPSNSSSWSGATDYAEYMWILPDGTYNRTCRVYYYIEASMPEYVVVVDESGC